MAPILPARSNDGASIAGVRGDLLDFRGGMPVLPAPVVGLVGPNSLNFPMQQPEAAPLAPSGYARATSSARTVPASLGARRDLKSGPRGSTGAVAAPAKRAEESLDRHNSQAEQAANGGRRLFDQDRARAREASREPGTVSRRASLGPAAGSGFGHAGASQEVSLARPAGGAPAVVVLRAPAGETLRDAVAGMPMNAAPASISPAALFAPALQPVTPPAVAAAVGPAAAAGARMGTEAFGAASRAGNFPASVLMGSGRSIAGATPLGAGAEAALHPVVAAAPAAMSPTVWLERGSLFEAVSVAEAYAGAGAHAALRSARLVSAPRAPAPASPSPAPMPAPSWWAWGLAPLLLAVVIRGNLR